MPNFVRVTDRLVLNVEFITGVSWYSRVTAYAGELDFVVTIHAIGAIDPFVLYNDKARDALRQLSPYLKIPYDLEGIDDSGGEIERRD